MGKHAKLEPTLTVIYSPSELARADAERIARWARDDDQATILHIDHRGDGSAQPAHPTPIDHLADAWGDLTLRQRRSLAKRHPRLVVAITTHLKGTDQ